MSPSLFLTVFPSRLQLNSQSWIQVCETAGRKVLYLSQMWNTHSFACWKSDRKYIYHLTDYPNADHVNPLTSTESSLTTFSGICQQITITDSIQPLTYICFLTILTNCPRWLFPRILSAPSTSGSAAQYSSQLLCLSLSSITSFQQQQPTYAHQCSFSLLNTAAD